MSLGIFSGEDTDWSLRFLPIYAGVAGSLAAVAGDGAGRSLVTGPAFRLGLFAMDRFHHAVRHWSRVREFAADAAGAQATSADASARALLRLGAATPRIAEVLAAAAEAPGVARDDLVSAVLDHACARGLDDPVGQLDGAQPHPTDTHPPTMQRLLALGRPPGPSLLAEAAVPPDHDGLSRLSALFADPARLCREATGDFLAARQAERQAYRDRLAHVAAAVGQGERQLYETTKPAIVLIGTAVLFGLVGLAMLIVHVPGLSSRDQSIMAGATLPPVPILVLWAAIMRRRAREPFLVLQPEAMCLSGLDRPMSWAHIADLNVAVSRGKLSTRVLLRPEAPFPARRPRARGIKLDLQQRIVTFRARTPAGMTFHAFAGLIAGYRQAASARTLLAIEDDPSAAPAMAR